MVQYLSDKWMQRANESLSASAALAAASADAELTVHYDITGAPGGKRSYSLRIDHGTAEFSPEGVKDAPVSFSLDYDTAIEIARGDTSAQAAFMQGRLKLGGDVTVLIRQHGLFDGLDDALAELRADTEY